jgi:phage terminase large subunit GpA-like protein
MQELKFEQFRWEKGKPYTVKYECVHCNELIEERYKTKMLADGEFIPDAPQNKSPYKIGFHVASFYSPIGWMSWSDIITDYEDCQNDIPKTITFTNTILGETYKQKGDVPEWNNLYNRRETYEINKPNKDVAFLTCGVDVQKDRLELHIIGWCKNKISYSIDYRTLVGETSNIKVWDELAKVVNETWIRDDGIEMPLKLMAVDSGYNTSFVYDFCRRFDTTRVIPIKGQDKQSIVIAPPRQVDTTSGGKKIGKIKVWNVGVSVIKSEIYGWLKLEIGENDEVPNGYMHFPQYNPEFFRGLTAEQLTFTTRKGYRKYEWIKKYHENEPLDTTVYARAAAAVIGLDRMKPEHYDQMVNHLPNVVKPVPSVVNKPVQQKRKSSYWD